MEELKNCPICNSPNQVDYMKTLDHFLTQQEFTIVKCVYCGFLFLNPRPTKNEIGKYYESQEYISHSNKKNGILNKLYHLIRSINHKKKYQIITSYIKEGSILDIGCATGEFLNFFKGKNWYTTGVEPNENALNFAKENYGLNVYDEEFLNRTDTEKYDVITMWHVLEHVHDINQRIEQVKNLLNNNGILVIAVPNPESYDAQKYQEFWAGFDLPRHLYHFSQKCLEQLLKNYNFNLIKTYPMKYDAYYVSLLSEKYKTGKKNILKAFISGYQSNIQAKKNQENFSSVIYVFKLNN